MISETGDRRQKSGGPQIPPSIQTLIHTLQSAEKTECWTAAGTLIEIGDVAVDGLIAALEHTSPVIRWRAAVVLGWISDRRAVDALISALADREWEVRHSAVWALGLLADYRAVEPLLILLHDEDTEEQMRYGAAMSIAAIHDRRAMDLLRSMRDVEDIRVGKAVSAALSNLNYS
jgi:HEAT repeat protein